VAEAKAPVSSMIEWGFDQLPDFRDLAEISVPPDRRFCLDIGRNAN